MVALTSHGYPVKNWIEAKNKMKQIASEHQWQIKHVPDARVLILIGLGNQYSDSDVLTEPRTRLE